MRHSKLDAVDSFTRNGVIIVGLAAVVFMAVVLRVESAQGALLTLLAAAVGYLFRGRVEGTSAAPAARRDPPVEPG